MLVANRVTLSGEITALEPLRHTPAGLPLMRMQITHASAQHEAGSERKVQCVVDAVAIGEIARRIPDNKLGAQVQVDGFLGNKFRTGTQLVLHLAKIEFIEN